MMSWATPAEIAKTYKTTVAYVYKLASTMQWRRARYEGRVYYHRDDADMALGKPLTVRV